MASPKNGSGKSRTAWRFALRGAFAMASCAALLITGANDAFGHRTDARGAIEAELAKGNTAKAVTLGEAAVANAPQHAALRATLGRAYLRAGRFESAAGMLGDASSLGDGSGRTMLSLALAQIASGEHRAALATLDRGSATLARTELGLALALAGDPERGIAILTDEARAGAADARLRQNLAYAYALDGRWADARLTASFDLPPDQLDARLQQWAQSMQSGGERIRIAALLNVPVIADRGMPSALALDGIQASPAIALAPQVAAAKR